MARLSGCDTLAYLKMYDASWYLGGCVLRCNSSESLTNGSCSGIGCCQTAIPKGTDYYEVQFDMNFDNSKTYNFSRCGYAVLMEDAGFEFNTRYITTNELYRRGQMPVVLDWTIGNQTCEIAQSNKSSYACISENSVCVDSTKYNGAPSYLCNCSYGYEGNPYLARGCQDIDECDDITKCYGPGTCRNVPGNYICFCPKGTHYMSYGSGACVPDQKLWMKIVVGLAAAICAIPILTLAAYMLNKKYKQRRVQEARQKNLKRHSDIIFRKHHDISGRMTIFGIEELEKATSKFDQTLIVGCGGHGIIYKGILSDQRIVAVKKPKIKDDREIEEFLNEVVILSQLNHKNIVKVFGCCLESEVPLLVYEFISNGTLTGHLHIEEGQPLSWNDRLRIALETAGALSYLHSSASISVFHRDIKTSNILLNDGLITKLSDFGASRSIPVDGETATTTAIQGTLGYLDPEYYQTGRLTTKSDVYSFGIILIEMLTRKKPISDVPNGVSLVEYFSSAIREARLHEILDPQVVEEEHIAELESVVVLAEKCVRSKGAERPAMKEVEMRLEVSWSSKHRSAYNWNRDQRLEQQRSLLENQQIKGVTSGAYSSEHESILLHNFSQ